MAKSKVYFTDLHTKEYGHGLPIKMQDLMIAAGFDQIDFEGKFVAIKMHFGETGNVAYIRPPFAKAIVDLVKARGGKPFLTDCNTMYPGFRKNALEHLYCAWENGFNPLSCGCPIIIGDGLKGTDEAYVPVVGGEYIKEAKIGRAIMDADIFISLNHFKGHNFASLGGALKNIGMGCGSRAGKTDQHSNGKPEINPDLCRGCRQCQKACANGGLVYDEKAHKMTVDHSKCVGCDQCIGYCNFDAIVFQENSANEMLSRKIAEYAKAVVDGRPNFHVSLLLDISPSCDCHCENDVPILPNIGMCASFDPLALDQACVDLCQQQEPMPGSQLYAAMHDEHHHEDNHFNTLHPLSDWKSCFEQAEKIGLGSRDYELIKVNTTK